jgi:hypothetical protein
VAAPDAPPSRRLRPYVEIEGRKMKTIALVGVAVFLALHGVAHLVGVVDASAVARPFWLAGAVAFWLTSYALFRARPWFGTALGVTATYSLLLSALHWPAAQIGVYLNLAILSVLAGLALRDQAAAARGRTTQPQA